MNRLFALVFTCVFAFPIFAQAPTATVFNNVRIYNGKSAQLSGTSHVLVRDNKIERISSAPIATDATTIAIDGGGRTLMPGLIDAHWHTIFARSSPASAMTSHPAYTYLAASAEARDTLLRGFTTVRDVGGPAFGLKQAIDEDLVSRAAHLSFRRLHHRHERSWRLSSDVRGPAHDRRGADSNGSTWRSRRCRHTRRDVYPRARATDARCNADQADGRRRCLVTS